MKSITLVAKGPSAVHAHLWCGDGEIATINDAGKLVPDREIKYAFFTDEYIATELMKVADRVQTFVRPRRSLVQEPLPDEITNKLVHYKEDSCVGTIAAFQTRILSGGICHHHTTPGAIHWLVRNGGYRHVRIIGVDGGKGYAAGVKTLYLPTQDLLRKLEGDNYLDKWAAITRRLCHILEQVYGARIEFYGR